MGVPRNIVRFLRDRRFRYMHMIEVRIYRDAILHNLHLFQKKHIGVRIAPVLKSNAYGHGLVQVAQILNKEDIPYICVDSFFEALILRNEGITIPILIIGYTPSENIVRCKLTNISFSILSLKELRNLVLQLQESVRCHIEIDTGMHRHGILPEEVEEAVSLIRTNAHLVLEGIYTHLADADTPDSLHTKKQIEQWNNVVRDIKKQFPHIRYIHAANTAGSNYLSQLSGNVMRLGIGLYGIDAQNIKLQPALEMYSRISSIREIHAGESVGYNATFTAKKEMRIASIPVGYQEGIDRRLSGKGYVLLRGVPCPIIGRISMNITTIDITHLPEARLDDPVLVISKQTHDLNSVQNMANMCGSIPYETLIHIPSSLRRRIV